MSNGEITATAECTNCDVPVVLSERAPNEHETVEKEVACICPECGVTIFKAWTATEITVSLIQ